MLILSRGCRKLDEACAGRCEGKGWRHDCQRANYNVFFWGALFSTALLCFLFSSSNAAWLFDVPFLFLSPFFLKSSMDPRQKEIHERKNRQRMKRHSHGFAKQANTTRFLFFFCYFVLFVHFIFLICCFSSCMFPFSIFFFPVFYFPVFPLLSSPSLCMCYSTYAVWLLADEWVPCQFMLLWFFFFSC